MGQSKPTFEKWTSKRKPKNVESARVLEEKRRVLEMAVSKRTQIDSGLISKGKGMKRTVDNPQISDPVGSTGLGREQSSAQLGASEPERGFATGNVKNTLAEFEEGVPSKDSGSGSPEFIKRQKKQKHVVPVDSTDKDKEPDEPERSTTRYTTSKNRSEDPEQLRESRAGGWVGRSSQRRSRSSSTSSVEYEEGGKKGRPVVSTDRRGNRCISSGEEDLKARSGKQHSSRAEWKRSSMDDHGKRKGEGVISKRRRHYRNGSSDSDNENRIRFCERGLTSQSRSSGRNVDYQDRSGKPVGSPRFVANTDLSDGSRDCHKRRQRSPTEGSNRSASDVLTDDDNMAVVEVKSETALQKGRRDKQKVRERQVRSREKQGQKAYYLQVNSSGKPYRDGALAWRLDLNKLARGLDPSVMDVREQSSTNMSTLRCRLRQNFDYSHPVDPIHIRQLVGRAITQWRNTLWKKMDGGKGCPNGFDANVWDRLQKTRACPSHAEKSERMKHANSCRITLGRTGPRGEEGVREHLRLQKGISPDYDDVFTEMQRDKGYGGRSAEKKKLKMAKENISVEGQAIRLWESGPSKGIGDTRGSSGPSTPKASNGTGDQEYIRALISEIAELKEAVALKSKGGSASAEGPVFEKCVDDEVDRGRPDGLLLDQGLLAHFEKECSSEGGRATGLETEIGPISKGASSAIEPPLEM